MVNRLVRADPEVRARLDEMSIDLRGAAGSADGTRIRELTGARSRLVDELTRQALQVADLPAPPAALREEVTATLDAAIADPEVAANLGTLVRAAHWAGFGLDPMTPFAAGAPSPSAPKTPTASASPRIPKPSQPPTPTPAEAAAERDRRRQEKLQQAERALAEADQATESANLAEQHLEDTVRRLEAELADARERLADARRQSYRAESRQRRANAELGRLRE